MFQVELLEVLFDGRYLRQAVVGYAPVGLHFCLEWIRTYLVHIAPGICGNE